MFFLALPRPRGFLCQKRGNFPLFFSLWKAKMPTFFKLNREPLSEGKEARYAVCTGYEEKSIHSSNILLRRQWRLSLLPFFLPSFLQGPQIALTDGIYRQRRRRRQTRRERRKRRRRRPKKRSFSLFFFFFLFFSSPTRKSNLHKFRPFRNFIRVLHKRARCRLRHETLSRRQFLPLDLFGSQDGEIFAKDLLRGSRIACGDVRRDDLSLGDDERSGGLLLLLLLLLLEVWWWY